MLGARPTPIILLATVLAAAAVPVSAQKGGEKVYWTGSSGGYRWRFTSRDITASKAGAPFSLARRMYPRPPDMEGLTAYANNVTPLSLVGSRISFRQDVYWEGGAHPSGAITYTTVDVSRPARPVRVTELFPDAAVRDALWADPVVRRTLAKAGTTRKPATAAALVKALEMKSFGGEDDGKYQFSPDLLSRFCFHHLEGNRVAVRLNVSWGYEINRFQSTEIGLLLPIPASLRGPLQRAAAQREGFLARSVRKRFENQPVTLVEQGMTG